MMLEQIHHIILVNEQFYAIQAADPRAQLIRWANAELFVLGRALYAAHVDKGQQASQNERRVEELAGELDLVEVGDAEARY
jgi:hypothetical protein